MKITSNSVGEHEKILESLCQREKEEFQAAASITTETLSKLNVTIGKLPSKCQQLLKNASKATQDIRDLDPLVVSLKHSKKLNEEMEQDYEILKLRQRNKVLQTRINRNRKMIDELKRELQESKSSLAAMDPGPEGILDSIRQLMVKVASYEENCDKAKAKFAKQAVPESIYPKSLEVLISQLIALKTEELDLKQQAEDARFTREMKRNLVGFRM